jgi:hypothetical protein
LLDFISSVEYMVNGEREMKPTEGRHVKGNVVIDYVKAINSNPGLPWSKYLLPEDMEIVEQMILPGSWYPIEFFSRAGSAVFNLIANGNKALARILGSSIADKINADHPGMISKGRPEETLSKYIMIQRGFYSFHAFDIGDYKDNKIEIKIYSKTDDPEVAEYIEQICGVIERLIHLSEYDNAAFEVSESVDGVDRTSSLNVSWSK